MEFLPESIQSYTDLHTEPESELLKKINRETHMHILHPRMLSGNLQGRTLAMISHMLQPNRILEIGTYTGYSALCLAEGLAEDGRVITIDINRELESRVKSYASESNFSGKIDLNYGNALDLIPELDETWDLVFIDADKENYLNYFNLVVENVRPGGFIIADNVLWSGKVIDESLKDIDTLAIRKFNKEVHNDSRVANVLLPIRDGLMMLRKL
ncbi:MAG: O-methyltransferase [Cytophagales bacterium]|nr:O-methyltransferase [Cytophagales bacterium]